MSENIIALANKKKNEIEFEMEVEGLTVAPSDIRFIIETDVMEYAFKCSKKKGKLYKVTIPPLPQLEKTLYPFKIEAVIDGYHFTPMTGQVNVAGAFDVYVSDAKNTTVAPPKKVTKKPATKKIDKDVTEKPVPKDIAVLAKKILGTKPTEAPANKKVAKKKVEPKKTPVKKTPVKKTPVKKTLIKEDIIKPTIPVNDTLIKDLSPEELVNIDTDNLVKDAIQNLRESTENIKPTPTSKMKKNPFFKKVKDKQEVVEKKASPVVQPSIKELKIHAILEGDTKDPKEVKSVISFKKGKRVKN